jgi:hypothetical protein
MVGSPAARPRLADFDWQQGVRDYLSDGPKAEALYQAVVRLVRCKTRFRPASIYSPIRVWELDAFQSIAVDVLCDLHKRGHLEKLTLTNKSNTQICRYFANAIEWAISAIGKARLPKSSKVYRTVKSALSQSGNFHEWKGVGWGLVEWLGHDFQAVAPEFVEERIAMVPICNFKNERRQPDRLPNRRTIADFCTYLIEYAGYPISLDLICEAARIRYGLFDTFECPIPVRHDEETGEEEAIDIADPNSHFPKATVRLLLEGKLGKLGYRDRRLITEVFLHGTKQRDLIGLGFAKSSVSNAKLRLGGFLRELGTELRTLGVVANERSTQLITVLLEEVLLEADYGSKNDDENGADRNSRSTEACRASKNQRGKEASVLIPAACDRSGPALENS